MSFCEFFDRYSLTIARWFPTLLIQRPKTGNYTTPRDVTQFSTVSDKLCSFLR